MTTPRENAEQSERPQLPPGSEERVAAARRSRPQRGIFAMGRMFVTTPGRPS